MECKVEKAERKGFKPVTLTVTIENELDLAWLMAISNCKYSTALENCDDFSCMPEAAKIIRENLSGHGKPQMAFYYAVCDAKKQSGFGE